MGGFLAFINNPFLVALLGAFFYAIQNFIEKLIFKHPGGDINKYYMVRNFIISWGFMFFLIWMAYFRNKWIDYKTAMDTISWGAFLNDNYLMGLSILASIFVIVSVYLSYLGIKFNPLSQYVPIQTLVYLLLTVGIGFLLLNEKLNRYQIIGILLGAVSIYLLQYKNPEQTATISNVE